MNFATRRQFLHLAAGAAALPAISRVARAQTYPTRPITIVVPYPAGGPTDAIIRVLVEGMRSSLGQSVVVDNVGGASGSVGTGRAVRAAPDGYTISAGEWGSHVASGAIYALQYDLVRDLQPVSLITFSPQILVTKKGIPVGDLKGLIAWLHANPDKATAGTSGVASFNQMSGILFQNLTRTHFQNVPYRGDAPAMQDLVSGQIDMMFANPANALPQIRAGTIKALAVTSSVRLATARDIPSMDEAGLPGFVAVNWRALWVPRGTPEEIVRRLNETVVTSLADPTVRQRLADMGQEVFPREQQSPAATGAHHKAEIEKWWPIIKAANIKVE